jgi:AraC-like DNA-binding protein
MRLPASSGGEYVCNNFCVAKKSPPDKSVQKAGSIFMNHRLTEGPDTAFEDIHAVAVRIAARKLTLSQKLDAERVARKLTHTVGAKRAEVKQQIERIAFFNEAGRAIGDDSFGFHLAAETDARELGIIYYVLSASATALDAMKNLVRYHHLVNSTTSLVVKEVGRTVAIDTTFRSGLEGFEKQVAEWGTTTFVAALRHLTAIRVVPLSLTFVHRRSPRIEEYRRFFGCSVQFGTRRQSIAFAKKDLLVPIHSADKHLLNILKAFCEEALRGRRARPAPTRAKVERTLLELLPNGNATVSQVAKALAISIRGLARRLNKEGTSYRVVLDEVRRELVMRYLEDETLNVNQIAWLVGYSEVSSFNHAFKRWTSSSPKTVRDGLKDSTH